MLEVVDHKDFEHLDPEDIRLDLDTFSIEDLEKLVKSADSDSVLFDNLKTTIYTWHFDDC